MIRKAKYTFWIIVFFIFSIVLTELVLRFAFGFGNPPLFEASDIYGYRLIPNQDIRRFGNRIFYNAQGLRSELIAIEPSAGTTRILCVGDSITYGGSIIDQADTYPYQLETILNSKFTSRYEVLNASAPSWSITDEENYMSAEGIYNSNIVILQISKDDIFQARCDKNVVGKLPNYPDKKPALALQELFVRYLPVVMDKIKPNDGQAPAPRNDELNLMSIARIKNYVDNKGGRLIIVYIGSRLEGIVNSSMYESAKSRLFNTINALGIDFVNLDDKFSSIEGDKLLRDKIHPNTEGNRVIAESLAEHILK